MHYHGKYNFGTIPRFMANKNSPEKTGKSANTQAIKILHNHWSHNLPFSISEHVMLEVDRREGWRHEHCLNNVGAILNKRNP